jgi:hypothetical protein
VITALCCLIASSKTSIQISHESFGVWKDAYRLTNGVVEVVVVPKVGRIMRFGRVGGTNLLYEGPLTPDGHAKYGGTWSNYGGDKMWPAPQATWGWPPETEYDPGNWNVTVERDAIRIWTTQPSHVTHVTLSRTIRMRANRSEVEIDNRLTNNGSGTSALAGWEICQVPNPSACYLPILKTPKYAQGWSVYGGENLSAWATPEADVVRITRDPMHSSKYGSASPAAWVSAEVGKETVRLSSRHEPGTFVDGGLEEQVYMSADPAAYAEIEITGPVKQLKPGQSLELRTQLSISPTHAH